MFNANVRARGSKDQVARQHQSMHEKQEAGYELQGRAGMYLPTRLFAEVKMGKQGRGIHSDAFRCIELEYIMLWRLYDNVDVE